MNFFVATFLVRLAIELSTVLKRAFTVLAKLVSGVSTVVNRLMTLLVKVDE